MTHITPARIDALWKQAFDASDDGEKVSHLFAALLFAEAAAPVPLTDVYAQFNVAIDFAIEQRTEAAVFLRAWREGDISEWPEFNANGITKGQ